MAAGVMADGSATEMGVDMERDDSSVLRTANIALALVFVIGTAALGYKAIGIPPVVIVGGSGLAAVIAWSKTYLKRPAAPETILPIFLLTVAALEIHMTEEYLTKFGPAMSRLFNITWTERGFLLVIRIYWSRPICAHGDWAVLSRPVRGIYSLVHLHRAWSRRVHALHLSTYPPSFESGTSTSDLARIFQWYCHLRYAELLHWNYEHVLFRGHVHGYAPHDSWDLCHLHIAEEGS